MLRSCNTCPEHFRKKLRLCTSIVYVSACRSRWKGWSARCDELWKSISFGKIHVTSIRRHVENWQLIICSTPLVYWRKESVYKLLIFYYTINYDLYISDRNVDENNIVLWNVVLRLLSWIRFVLHCTRNKTYRSISNICMYSNVKKCTRAAPMGNRKQIGQHRMVEKNNSVCVDGFFAKSAFFSPVLLSWFKWYLSNAHRLIYIY